MKILVVSFYYEPDLSAGSFRTTALVRRLTEQLTDQDSIKVLTTMPNRYGDFAQEAEKEEQQGNIRIKRIKIPTHKSGMFDQAKAYIVFYRSVLKTVSNEKDYAVVYATSSRLFTAFLGARISRKIKAPLYLDIRDIFLDTLDNVLNKKLLFVLRPFLKAIEKYTFKCASHINLVSKGFAEYFNIHYPRKNYSYFTNGIDKEFIVPINIDSEVEQESKTILYAGNIGEGQGLHNIIPKLAQKLPHGLSIKVIGGGGRKPELLEQVQKNNITNVQIFDPVERQELIKEYRAASILFLHLNDYDAFKKVLPSKIFEYAAIGKPILAGVSGYAEKFLNDEVLNAAVFPPCNEEKAIQALQSLVLKDTNRVQFIKNYSRKNIMQAMAKEVLSFAQSVGK